MNENDEIRLDPAIGLLPEINRLIRDYLSEADIRNLRLVSKRWKSIYSDRNYWRNKIQNSFDMPIAFIEGMQQRSADNVEFICYHALSKLLKNKKRLEYSIVDKEPKEIIRSALDPTGFESELLIDCLLDDMTLLKKTPRRFIKVVHCQLFCPSL